jgi:pseudouridine synthase
MRLNRFLAAAGLGSRRSCEDLVREGRIEVNGVIVTFPGHEVEPGTDNVCSDGERVRAPRRWLYYVMYKLAGYVTTRADERGRKTVDELLGRLRGRVFPVGRLDRATEGLLLFTNNGELAERLLHPRFHHERTYVAWVTPPPGVHTLRAIEAGGVPIGRGGHSGPAKARLIGRRHDPARVRITLHEGKYREVRRIFRAFDLRVLVLRRVSFAGLLLNDLEPGGIRPLTELERELLAKRSGLIL